jgi:hypothetical protein
LCVFLLLQVTGILAASRKGAVPDRPVLWSFSRRRWNASQNCFPEYFWIIL